MGKWSAILPQLAMEECAVMQAEPKGERGHHIYGLPTYQELAAGLFFDLLLQFPN